jgi:hypothetical protein
VLSKSAGAGNRVGKPDKVSSRVGGGVNAPNPLVVEELAFFFLGFCADSADDDGDTTLAFRHRVRAFWFVNPLVNPHQRITKIAAADVVLMVDGQWSLCVGAVLHHFLRSCIFEYVTPYVTYESLDLVTHNLYGTRANYFGTRTRILCEKSNKRRPNQRDRGIDRMQYMKAQRHAI